MDRKFLLIIGTLLTLAITPAIASSDAAWQQHDKQVKQACKAASGLNNIVWLSQPIGFDDTVGYTALRLKGEVKPAPHSKTQNKQVVEQLCLYERKSGNTRIAEVPALK